MFEPDVYRSTPEKKLRKERALTKDERKKEVKAMENSFKDRALSDVLGEVLDHKDLNLWVSVRSIGVEKEYPLAPAEAVKMNQEQIDHTKWLIQDLETRRPYRDPNFGIGPENRILSEEEIVKRIESAHSTLKFLADRTERLQAGKETASVKERVLSFGTAEVMGNQDAELANRIDQKSQKLKEKFHKQVLKYSSILNDKREVITNGKFGIGNFSEIKEVTLLEHYIGLLGNVATRLRKDPALNSKLFIREHVLAAAGRKYDRSTVEGFDSEKLDALVDTYEAKYKEYEEKLQPFDTKKKPSQGPYR